MVNRIFKILAQSAWIIMIPCALSGRGLRFEKEKITVVAGDSTVSLTGEYYFRNPMPDTCSTEIFYPFVVLPSQPFPDFIRVCDASDERSIEHGIRQGGIQFKLAVDPFEMRVIRVECHQPVRSTRFEYLLTTTASWGDALRLAEYRIILPPGCEMKFCSFPFTEIRRGQGQILFLIRQEIFLPRENLVIQWGAGHEK